MAYITKDQAKEVYNDFLCGSLDIEERDVICNGIDLIPEADVVERKKGKWMPYQRRKLTDIAPCVDEFGNPFMMREHVIITRYKCSVCGCIEEVETNFCCDCGADMREVNE